MRPKKVIVFGVLLALSAAMAFIAIPQLAATSQDNGTMSDVAEIGLDQARTDVTVSLAGSIEAPASFARFRGEIRARRESSLAIRRSGQLQSVLVEEGDVVKKGQLLAKLDTADLDVREQLADADIDVASSVATEAVAGPRYQTVKASAARVRQLQAQMAAAEKRLERQQQLSLRNSGSAQELDDAKFAAEELQARLDAATAELEELNEGTRVEQVEVAKARRRAAVAARLQVDIDRADSEIVAPYQGVIANRYFDEGEILTAGQPVLRILETDPIEARFGVPANVASDWRIGDPMMVAIGSIEVPAKVVRMQPQVDPITRTRGIDVQLDGTQLPPDQMQSIMVGQTAALQVPLSRHPTSQTSDDGIRSFWIPTESLVRGSRGLWAIYVAVPDVSPGGDQSNATIERREVRVLQTAGLISSVEGMLASQEWVVTDGAHRIGPGVAVRCHLDEPANRQASPAFTPEPTLSRESAL